MTPFGFRSGDLVEGTKAGETCKGWVGGYTKTEKTNNVSIYDHNWKRIGQFSPNKVKLVATSNLDVATSSVLPDSKLADSEFSTLASLSLPTAQTDGESGVAGFLYEFLLKGALRAPFNKNSYPDSAMPGNPAKPLNI